jgi:hypothetical protein
MKRMIPVAVALLILTAACASQKQSITYRPPQEAPLIAKTIGLVVRDVRQDKEVLSPTVQEMKIMSGLGGVVNLLMPKARASLDPTDIVQAFDEALKIRLANIGVAVRSGDLPDGTTLAIDIEKVRLDLVSSNFRADVNYLARVIQQGKVIHEERVLGNVEKYNLLGEKTGREVISQAFSTAINNLPIRILQKPAGQP